MMGINELMLDFASDGEIISDTLKGDEKERFDEALSKMIDVITEIVGNENEEE